MLTLGFSGQALGYTMPFDKICKIGRKYNMRVCEVWECNAAGDGLGWKNRDIKEMKRIADSEGVRIECVTLGAAFGYSGSAEEYSDMLCYTIEAAAETGALRINHYCAAVSPNEADFARMEEFWAKPIKLAEEYKITLALENEAHDATKTPDRMLKIMEHFKNPYFKTNLDCTNYYQAGADGFPDAYETLKPYIGYIHLKNAHNNYDNFKYVPVPDGAVNIHSLVCKVKVDKSYNGLCSLEPHVAPEKVEEYYKIESAYLNPLF